MQALNGSLAATSGVQAGLIAFANQAAVADLDPAGSATFLPPGFTGGDPRPRVDTVAGSVTRAGIGLYDPRPFGPSGSGDAFTSAISVALSTLRAAPAGPKWIMLLSDGASGIDNGVLAELGQSDVRLRSFGIGADATCEPAKSLYKMAAVTGESCQVVTDPGVAQGRPDRIPARLAQRRDRLHRLRLGGGDRGRRRRLEGSLHARCRHLHRHRAGRARLRRHPDGPAHLHRGGGRCRPRAGHGDSQAPGRWPPRW